MKKFLITLLLFLIMLPAVAKTLTGGVVYTVESARKAAFEGIEYEISMEPFKKYMTDPGFISPAKTEGGKPKVSKKGRRVTFFSDGEYAISYKNNIYSYYYKKNGQLVNIVIDDANSKTYPFLSKKYDLNGKLVRVFLIVSSSESFVFTPDKLLTAHWLNDKCYDENNKIKSTRTSNF